ncbi:hypothetical protein P7K49_034553 [Saguinus oedipus]|uniref:Uncharacterized protein n=1 Tax=Saguinus oedipus TaxID=9490 RepID=A0ABQ9TV26_SAGOE|nr:hypothetical protein P7K49_034553 [Saguinus oedipus]
MLSLSSITFDSNGTYVCEASLPTVPVLSRTQNFTLLVQVTSALSRDGISCEASNPHGNARHVFHFGIVSPQTSQAGVAVMAVAVSVGLLLLVVAVFYCMRRKGGPGCHCRREKGAP